MASWAQRCFQRRRAEARAVACLCALALMLSACDALRGSLGLDKRAPDEFAVVPSAPLALPPDYRLRPPELGAPRPTEMTPREQAETALFESGGTRRAEHVGPETPGEIALLDRAGAADANPEIRRIIDREFSPYVEEDESFFESLLFWRRDDPPGEVVDPVGESRRLRENAALGEPVTAGETPTIRRREKALLEGIF